MQGFGAKVLSILKFGLETGSRFVLPRYLFPSGSLLIGQCQGSIWKGLIIWFVFVFENLPNKVFKTAPESFRIVSFGSKPLFHLLSGNYSSSFCWLLNWYSVSVQIGCNTHDMLHTHTQYFKWICTSVSICISICACFCICQYLYCNLKPDFSLSL